MGAGKEGGRRSERLVLRVSVVELERIRAAAGVAGVAVSELVRRRVLGVEQASVGGSRREGDAAPGPGLVAAETPAAPAERPATAWDRHQLLEARKRSWFCPVPLCQECSAVRGGSCPVHGVLMDVKA
jgi:hypothetical protein